MSNSREKRGAGNTVIQRKESLNSWYTHEVVTEHLFKTFQIFDLLPSIRSSTKLVTHTRLSPGVEVESQQLPPPQCRSSAGSLSVG